MLKKGQSAIEFVLIVAAVFFFFIAFLFGIQTNIADKIREQKSLTVKEIALTLQNEINLASEASDGYHREFKISPKVAELDYDVSVVDGLVYIITEDEKHSIALPVPDITGQPQPGGNVIRKEDGVIILNG